MHGQDRPRPRVVAAILLALLGALGPPGFAWWPSGHARVTRAAVRALPPGVPRFFREGGWTAGEASIDPDLLKDRTLPALRAFEDPQHYLDWELLQGAPLPADRWAFVALCNERKVRPEAVGLLPYALLESVQRLTLTFAEHRRYPNDVAIQQKALVYAGWLAHYAGDLEQPLHTTMDHDGRALPDGSSPRSGIHSLVDSLFDRAPFDERTTVRDVRTQVFADPWVAILAELTASHALVDRVYELEPHLRAAFPPEPSAGTAGGGARPPSTPRPPVPPAVTAFAGERYRTTAAFLSSLYRTAWERSASIELPFWLERPKPPRR
jgi:hypothetical protein